MMPMLCSPLLATSSQPDAARALPCSAIAHSTNERLRNAVSRCFIGAVSYHQAFRMGRIPNEKDTWILGFQRVKELFGRIPKISKSRLVVFQRVSSRKRHLGFRDFCD